jgi:hypothetical protein
MALILDNRILQYFYPIKLRIYELLKSNNRRIVSDQHSERSENPALKTPSIESF